MSASPRSSLYSSGSCVARIFLFPDIVSSWENLDEHRGSNVYQQAQAQWHYCQGQVCYLPRACVSKTPQSILAKYSKFMAISWQIMWMWTPLPEETSKHFLGVGSSGGKSKMKVQHDWISCEAHTKCSNDKFSSGYMMKAFHKQV